MNKNLLFVITSLIVNSQTYSAVAPTTQDRTYTLRRLNNEHSMDGKDTLIKELLCKVCSKSSLDYIIRDVSGANRDCLKMIDKINTVYNYSVSESEYKMNHTSGIHEKPVDGFVGTIVKWVDEAKMNMSDSPAEKARKEAEMNSKNATFNLQISPTDIFNMDYATAKMNEVLPTWLSNYEMNNGKRHISQLNYSEAQMNNRLAEWSAFFTDGNRN